MTAGRRAPMWGLALMIAAASGCAADSAVRHDGPHGGFTMHSRDAADGNTARPTSETPAIPLADVSDLARILPALSVNRVVYVGETHDQYAHHLVQLEIIRHLYEDDRRLAIGMEFFQRPFQDVLDRYVAGVIDEREMLRETDYYNRWSYDYRLYAPILRYAREHGIPLVALNASTELVRKVRASGLEGLNNEDKALLPADIDRSDEAHERRLQAVLEQHPHGGDNVDRFMEVQVLWDESMAESAANWLKAHPEHRMVVLAGSGHLAHGGGIPDRVKRRVPVTSAIVLNDWKSEITPGLADYLLMPDEQTLPPAGMIGARIETDEVGLKVESCSAGSACEEIGLQRGDRLVAIDGVELATMADLRLLMWDKLPGDTVTLTVQRERRFTRADMQDHIVRLR
jgi:uncharacterized iron-regulated protein